MGAGGRRIRSLCAAFTALAAALAAAACSSHDDAGHDDGASHAKSRDGDGDGDGYVDACFGLLNARTTKKYGAIGLILQLEDGAPKSRCTGTFVSSNTMITAAHCVPPDSSPGVVYLPVTSQLLDMSRVSADAVVGTGVRAKRVFRNDYPTTLINDTRLTRKDLAVVVFPDGTAPAMLDIAAEAGAAGDEVTLVGFGITHLDEERRDEDLTARKRVGHNVLVENEVTRSHEDAYFLAGSAENGGDSAHAIASHGDSGGPLLLGGRLLGVASSAGPAEGELDRFFEGDAINTYASVTSQEAATLFAKARKGGAVIPKPVTYNASDAASCGD
jgi:hypothetical protein